MSSKNKKRAILLLLVALGSATAGCSAELHQPKPSVAAADDPGEEEVLSDEDADRDEFGRPKPAADTVAGQVLVVIGYLGMIIGSAVLPFLLL